MRARFPIQSPDPSPAGWRRARCHNVIFGVLTSRLPTFRCHGRRRRTRNSLSSTAMYSRTVLRWRPSSRDRPGRIEQLAVSYRQESEQARDPVGIPHSSHIPVHPVDNALHVLAMPLAGASRAAGEGFRISSGDQAPREIGRIRQLAASPQSRGDRSCQNVSKKRSPGRRSFSASERAMRRAISMRPASDSVTVGTRRRLAEPVRTKRPGRRSRSTESLDGGQQLRCALDLVDGDLTRECGNKARGIRFGGGQIGRVVKNVTSWKP